MAVLTRVLVVEDDAATAEAIRAILSAVGSYALEVAASGARAEEVVAEFAPDLILLDLGLPDRDGVEVIRALRSASFDKYILVLTASVTEERIVAAVRAGADGYLFKDDLDSRLASALAEVATGGAPMSSGAVAAVLREVRREGAAVSPGFVGPRLTPKERLVLDALSMGGGYREIAESLGIELNTVRTHIRSLYEKLGVENRAEAVNLGWSLGVLRRPRL